MPPIRRISARGFQPVAIRPSRADAWGDPEWPLDRAGIEAKLRTLTAWGSLPDAEADAAIALVLDGADDAPAMAVVELLERWLR
jgi:hypothetical protein